MTSNPRSRSLRATLSITTSLVVVAAVVVVTVAVNRDDRSSTAVPVASSLSASEVKRGDLIKTDKVDGRLRYTDTLTVLHRIAGQPAVAAGSPQGGQPRVAHWVRQDAGTTTTLCATTSSPTSSAEPPVASAPCSPSGGGGGGGAARPGGGASRGASSGTATVARISQIVTSVVRVGAVIGSGDLLYTIDGYPVVALPGAIPAWRSLSVSSGDGADVEQLERALVGLGYDRDGAVTVDEHFDSDTDAMVRRWQTGLAVSVTGRVALGSVVFIPRASTVASVARTVGDQVGDADEMLTLAGATQRVVIDVPVGDEQYFVPGLQVRLNPGGTGTVELLRSVSRNSTAVVQAVIAPDAPIDGADNSATVVVSVDLRIEADVLIVPSQSLVSRLDGSYAVQVRDESGAVAWVSVALVGVAGSQAGVSADGLDAGSTVLTPSA